ncbi:trihelix transcription factor GTL1-like [Mercurialis annua]|uniref:trihelix transcription factor GTL1-like n=1 Tax=Mercurialis annua TaxID=3986 RepID=UPI00215E4CD2|nr:trihelix transcription factor GTL1-like [Mercurialis annua]
MELLTGDDRRVTNATGFTQQVSPFQETESFLVCNPTAVIHSSPSSPPLQKLNPIRPNGRSTLLNSQGNGMSMSTHCGLENLGMLVEQVCGVNGDGGDFFMPAPGKAEGNETRCNRSGHPNYEAGLLGNDDDNYSSASDDDPLCGINDCGSRKRKRKSTKKLEDFLETLVMKVMEKQERMHNQLIETIERKERERVIRDEAWKQQERDKIKRNEEIRAQENARNLALISFIQKAMGHKVEIPQYLTMIPPPDKSEENSDRADVPLQKDFDSDSSGKRWPKAEVQTLITLRASLGSAKNSNIWDVISDGMCNMGYNRNAKKCKEKWENMNKYFRKSIGSGEKRNENSKTCPYFHDLDILYKSGFVIQ